MVVYSCCAGAQRRRFLFRIWSFKRSSVQKSGVRCLYGKNGQNTEWYLRRPGRQIPLGLFFSRFSRCRRKVRLRGEGMICRDPKKVDFFSIFGPFQLCLHTPSQNDKKITPAVLERSCPRTYLPSRAGATHALRVLSS